MFLLPYRMWSDFHEVQSLVTLPFDLSPLHADLLQPFLTDNYRQWHFQAGSFHWLSRHS